MANKRLERRTARVLPGHARVSYGSSKNSFVIIGGVLQLGAMDAHEQDLSFDMRVCTRDISVANASSAAIAAHLVV